MSVIVCRERIIAADRAINNGNELVPAVKLVSGKYGVFGYVGRAKFMPRLLDFVCAHRWQDFPKIERVRMCPVEGRDMLINFRPEGITVIDMYQFMMEHPEAVRTVGYSQPFVIGSAYAFAAGAVHAGAGAIEAVRIANKLSTTCGLGVLAYDIGGDTVHDGE